MKFDEVSSINIFFDGFLSIKIGGGLLKWDVEN
jgi:hypothetical protein